MGEYIFGFLLPWFAVPHLTGLALALVFGAIWLAAHWPPLFREYWLWAVFILSAFLTAIAIAFIQIPLQILAGQLLGALFSQQVLMSWLLLAGIPSILLSGLVQEGAKMLPMVVWRWRREWQMSPGMGLAVGAMAGAGFGIFEAVWTHNQIFASGCTLQSVQTGGVMALAGFIERFLVVGFHIAVSALAGYGLAKGLGWQFYLIASFLHGLVNYAVVLLQGQYLTIFQVEIYVAVVALLVSGAALWLRWGKAEESDFP